MKKTINQRNLILLATLFSSLGTSNAVGSAKLDAGSTSSLEVTTSELVPSAEGCKKFFNAMFKRAQMSFYKNRTLEYHNVHSPMWSGSSSSFLTDEMLTDEMIEQRCAFGRIMRKFASHIRSLGDHPITNIYKDLTKGYPAYVFQTASPEGTLEIRMNLPHPFFGQLQGEEEEARNRHIAAFHWILRANNQTPEDFFIEYSRNYGVHVGWSDPDDPYAANCLGVPGTEFQAQHFIIPDIEALDSLCIGVKEHSWDPEPSSASASSSQDKR